MKSIIGTTPADHRNFWLGMLLMLCIIVLAHYLLSSITGAVLVDLTDYGTGAAMGFLIGWIWHD